MSHIVTSVTTSWAFFTPAARKVVSHHALIANIIFLADKASFITWYTCFVMQVESLKTSCALGCTYACAALIVTVLASILRGI